MGQPGQQRRAGSAGWRWHRDGQRDPLAAADAQPAAQRRRPAPRGRQPHVQAVDELAVVDPDPARPQPGHHLAVAVAGHADVRTAELSRPEVAARLRGAGLHRVGHLAEAVERGAGRVVAVAQGVEDGPVVVRVAGDREEPTLGEQGVPHAADRGGHPVEAAVGHVRLGRIARASDCADGLFSYSPRMLVGTAAARQRGALGARRALHPDHDLRGGVAPRAQLVRGVDAQPRRVVGQHQCVVDEAGGPLGGEPPDGGDGQRLVRGRAFRAAEQLAVVGALEPAQHLHLVRHRVR